ncbi:MAG: hypothetical protein ACJAWM_000717 [Sulfitobacter sp.]|jgi:hypothetical protein
MIKGCEVFNDISRPVSFSFKENGSEFLKNSGRFFRA